MYISCGARLGGRRRHILVIAPGLEVLLRAELLIATLTVLSGTLQGALVRGSLDQGIDAGEYSTTQ